MLITRVEQYQYITNWKEESPKTDGRRIITIMQNARCDKR